MREIPTTERDDWERYRNTGDISARNRLVERHLPLVHHFARRMQARAGDLELDDLVSAGSLGLLDAVSAFAPDRGYRFSTFAAPRIRGAMLDEMRRRDAAPRSVRRKQRLMREVQERLSVELDRAPRHAEVADSLGVDTRTLWRWKTDIDRSNPVPLDELGRCRRSRRAPEPAEWDEDQMDERLNHAQEVRRLRLEMRQLNDRERLVIERHDFQSWTLRQISKELGVSESRVSQIRSAALSRLRGRMLDLRELEAA